MRKGKGGSWRVSDRLLFREDPIDLKALWFVEEERLVESIGEAAIEFFSVVGCDDEDVLFVRDGRGTIDVAGRAGVVDQGAVEVEREAVVHVTADVVDCDDLFAGGVAGDLTGERTGGVAEVELFAVEAKEKDEGCEDGDEGRVADL